MTPRISFCLTVADEEKEFRKLYETLRINKRDEDNILVLVDETKCPKHSDFHEFLMDLHKARYIKLISGNFQGNFSEWKNQLREHPMVKDWLVFLDADELLPPQLIDDLPLILELNPDVDVIGLPRQNFTEGITPEDVKKWGWTLDELGRNCWPDYQWRIMRNKPGIQWSGQVHETITGYKIKTELPAEPPYAILHCKTIDKQRLQNSRYETGDYSK